MSDEVWIGPFFRCVSLLWCSCGVLSLILLTSAGHVRSCFRQCVVMFGHGFWFTLCVRLHSGADVDSLFRETKARQQLLLSLAATPFVRALSPLEAQAVCVASFSC